MPDYTIRAATADDLNGMLTLFAHLHPDDDPLPSEADVRARWQAFVAHEGVTCFVVEQDGELVASCTLIVVPNLTHGARPYGLIENVITHAGRRRRGLGRAVMLAAMQAAWDAGCYKVMLQTHRNLSEVGPFYEGLGFTREGVTAYEARRPERPTAESEIETEID